MAQIVTDSPVPARRPDTRRDQHMAPGWWIIPMALVGAFFWGALFMWLL